MWDEASEKLRLAPVKHAPGVSVDVRRGVPLAGLPRHRAARVDRDADCEEEESKRDLRLIASAEALAAGGVDDFPLQEIVAKGTQREDREQHEPGDEIG